MRTLLLMRGLPASGKSTWIYQHGLEHYALSPDALRLMASAPILLPVPKVPLDSATFNAPSSACNPSATISSVSSSSVPSATSLAPSFTQSPTSSLYAIYQHHDKHIWKMLFALLELRMERGDFTIIDATHTSEQALRAYEGLASIYRYRIYVLDFSDTPLDVIKARNITRGYKALAESVLDMMYERLQKTKSLPSRYAVLRPQDIALSSFAPLAMKQAHSAPSCPLLFTPINLSHYESIHHIGDIHGCIDALISYLLHALMLEGHDVPYASSQAALSALHQASFAPHICRTLFAPTSCYIFLGDYIDRGVHSGGVVLLLLGVMDMPNIRLLEGNHERWLRMWGEKELGENEFTHFTEGDLMRVGLTPKDTHRLYSKLHQCAYYVFHKESTKSSTASMYYRVLCTHGGLPTLPHNLLLISSRQMIYGTGDYEDMLDTAHSFTTSTDAYTYQVFGHRNRARHAIRVHERNFALEGGVEYGRALRACILRKKPLCIDSAITPKRTKSIAPLAQENWLAISHKGDGFYEITLQNGKNPRIQSELHSRMRIRDVLHLLHKLRNSSHVKERQFGVISSFNFTKDVFYQKQWSAITCKARGLFIDTKHYAIYARSYDKFFNIHETQESSLEALQARLVYPISVYVKENGFLGIASVNWHKNHNAYASFTPIMPHSLAESHAASSHIKATTPTAFTNDVASDKFSKELAWLFAQSLFITSKSNALSPYALTARILIYEALTQHARIQGIDIATLESRLIDEIASQNLSLVFEVIDPSNDPHIIAYNTPHVVLLDAIYNAQAFSKLPYGALQELGARYGFMVKQRYAELASWEELLAFLAQYQQEAPYTPYTKEQLLGSGEREDGFIEGFVLEDSAGFMLKMKTPYYRGWKALRSLLDISSRTKKRAQHVPKVLEKEFTTWLEATSLSENTSIISARKQFLSYLASNG